MSVPGEYIQRQADEQVLDSRFSFRREFDQAFQIYKKLNNEMFMLRNVITTETQLFLYEDVYDISFRVYEGVLFNLLKNGLKAGLSYRILGTIAENFVNIMDVFNFLVFLLLFIVTPLSITSGYEGLCVLILIALFFQIYFSAKIRGMLKFLLPSMILFIICFALLITRGVKTSRYNEGEGAHEEKNNFMCVNTKALGNFYSFETCDKHDKVYIWITFVLIYIANMISIFVYVKFVRSLLHYIMLNNFYLYVMNKIRQHRICLTIEHIKREPAWFRWKLPFWSTDISESLHVGHFFVTTPILNCVLDDMIAGIESGKIKLKNFKIGRESAVIVEFLKELIKSKSKLLD